MTYAARERLHVWLPLLLSAGAWVVLANEQGGNSMSAHCSMQMQASALPSLKPLLFGRPLFSFVIDWTLMLAAMMLPLLIAPLRHVRERSFTHRRLRSIALFVIGYGVIWMVAGIFLLALTLAIRFAIPVSWGALALALLVAITWQFSPMKQRCLNRNHAHFELAAFGYVADLDAVNFGWRHGMWCCGSCWALMLLPMLVSRGHLVVMAGVTLFLFAERLDRPMPPRWRLRTPAKAVRLAVAQTRARFQSG